MDNFEGKETTATAKQTATVVRTIIERQADSSRIAELLRQGYRQNNSEDYTSFLEDNAERLRQTEEALQKMIEDGTASPRQLIAAGFARLKAKDKTL